LVDICYALTTAMILRDPMLGTNDLLRFVRAKDLRTPRDAVRRCTGMDLAALCHLAQRERGAAATSLLAMRLVEGAVTRDPHRTREIPLRIYRHTTNHRPMLSVAPVKA
jgi:hypothetical protein